MSDFGNTNAVSLKYVKETTWGETPSNPALNNIPYTGEDFKNERNTIETDDITADHMLASLVQTGTNPTGSFNFELRSVVFEDFLAATLFSDWVTTGDIVAAATDIAADNTGGKLTATVTDFTSESWVVGQYIAATGFSNAVNNILYRITEITDSSNLVVEPAPPTDEAATAAITLTPLDFVRNGQVKTSFTIQKKFGDIATDTYQNFDGCVCNTLSLTLNKQDKMTGSLAFFAKGEEMTETPFSGATFPAFVDQPIFNTSNDIANLVVDGASSATFYDSLGIEITNNLRADDAVGAVEHVAIENGKFRCNITADLFFELKAEYEKFQNQTQFSFSIAIQDPNGLAIIATFPKCQYTDSTVVAGGNDAALMAKTTFSLLKYNDGSAEYQLQFSRT